MKSRLILLLASLCTLLTGCSASFKSHTKKIDLTGNPSTGYTWIVKAGDESIISVDEKITYLGKDGITGAPSLYVYTLHSLKEGNTTLKTEYRRPWENEKAEISHFYNVSVKKGGQIEMKETKDIPLENNGYTSVSMEEGLKMMAENGGYILLDVRRPDEYASGHIPGAQLLTNETFTEEDAEKLISDKAQRVYVYCRSGRRSKMAGEKLAGFGYKNVIEIGGILDYSGIIEK